MVGTGIARPFVDPTRWNSPQLVRGTVWSGSINVPRTGLSSSGPASGEVAERATMATRAPDDRRPLLRPRLLRPHGYCALQRTSYRAAPSEHARVRTVRRNTCILCIPYRNATPPTDSGRADITTILESTDVDRALGSSSNSKQQQQKKPQRPPFRP